MAKKKPKKATPRAAKDDAAKYVPERITAKRRVIEREDEGPRGWFLEQMSSTLSQLAPAGLSETLAPTGTTLATAAIATAGIAAAAFEGLTRLGQGVAGIGLPALDIWRQRLAEYKRRKIAAALAERAALAPTAAGPAAPFVPGGRNWVPLGPSMVLEGQTVGEESVGGRIVGLAISQDGATIYAASACGGVFRSDDAGTSWRSLMDNFDADPANFASTSLACGAIAIDPGNPDRIYVGTGEGETHQLFDRRIVNALPAYRGIGPIRSDDGGESWHLEKSAAGSADLAGKAFFALAVDPGNPNNVVAATTDGLYQRVAAAGGGEWHRRQQGVFCSVVIAQSGATTHFLAARWGGGVFQSPDGLTWSALGSGFPTNNVGRISLGVQPTNPNVVYALVANEGNGGLHGVYRLSGLNAAWKKIANPPNVLPLNQGSSQGAFDLAIAVDPVDANLIYLGGSYSESPIANDPNWPWPGSVWRAKVQAAGTGWKFVNAASIGTHAHADVHVLKHTPANPNELWCGCDGGVFLNRAPRGGGEFAGLNSGLSCLCSNFIAQHPTDPGILLTGLQDNGTAHTSGGPQWNHVNYGDGGYCLFNWANPAQALSFVNGRVYRSNNGGASHAGWSLVWNFGWATMTQPIVSVPFDADNLSNAKWVAVGAGALVYVSKDFAGTWPMQIALPGGNASGSVFALAFASTSRIFIGTTRGRVFRADLSGTNWVVTRLDNVAGGPLGVSGLVTDVAVDWSDATLSSIYACFGGMGDQRHVWRFHNNAWEARSGTTAGSNLLDVEHNALAVDSQAPQNVYVGADIGVWHSPDQGLTWIPLQNGLPDAPVFDLHIHPTQRLLRAATHGRGVYEIALP